MLFRSVAGVGFFAWQAVEHWLGRLRDLQLVFLMMVLLVATLGWLFVQWRRR